MELSLAYSPCPNDTFIFEAMVHGRVPTEGLSFKVTLADISELNQLARAAAVDVLKASYFAYYFAQGKYALLEAGSALGQGVGPLLVGRKPLTKQALREATLAIPGWDTTAHLLLQHYLPDAWQRQVMRFDEIMPAVARGEVTAGVIIHEGRFVYANYGLTLLQDLGEYWEQTTGAPIPLGGILAKKALGTEVIAQVDAVLRRSVEYAFANPQVSAPYVAQHAQEMDPAVRQAHIDLYVNRYSLALGAEGHRAVELLLTAASRLPSLAH